MIKRWAWILPVLSSVLASVLAAPVMGQYGPGGGFAADQAALMQAQFMAQAMMAPPGMMPGGQMQSPGGPPGALPDVYGNYGSMPMGGQDAPIAIDGPAGCGCPYCGGHGCEMCGYGGHKGDHGLLGELLGICGPYADGGCAAVRWFDVAVDYMHLRREDPGRNVALTGLGINAVNGIVLQTSDLDFDDEAGFRFTGCLQVGPGSNVEFTYFGTFQYQDSAFVRRSGFNDLFSVFSQFGTVPFGGFPETDESDFQQIDYASTFDSFEINFRQRWMAPNCRYQGSWVCGVRHFILDETFRYFTSSSANGFVDVNGQFIGPAQSRFDVDTTNNLTGFQLGADLWICILPGLRAGGEIKAGVYGNHMNANTTAGVNTGAPTFIERVSSNDVSFVGQADLTATYRINYNWTARVGYNFLFVDGVALAPENFNTVWPFPPNVGRVATLNDNGNVFYHGWFAGLEFMW